MDKEKEKHQIESAPIEKDTFVQMPKEEVIRRIKQAKAHGYYEVPEVADKTERVHVDKDMEVIKYDWLTENRMVNEADIIADKHGIETIDVIRTFGNDDMIAGFYWGNAIEYMIHYRNKNGLEDLKKARKNLDWLIEHMEGF